MAGQINDPIHAPGSVPDLSQSSDRCMRLYASALEAGDDDACRHLSASVSFLFEAYSLVIASDERRVPIASRMGKQLMAKWLTCDGPNSDRDTAIDMFTESLARPGLDPGDTEISLIAQGMMLMLRALPADLRTGSSAVPDFNSVLRTMQGVQIVGTPQVQADLSHAVDNFQRLVDTEPVHREIRHFAPSMLALALLMQKINGFTTGGAGFGDIIGLLGAVTQLMSPQHPGRVEMRALRAWLMADALTAPGGTSQVGEIMKELEEATALFPVGHLLRPALLLDWGLAAGLHGERGGPVEYLTRMPDLMDRALSEMPDDYPLREQTTRMMAGAVLAATGYQPTHEGVDNAVRLALDVLRSRKTGDVVGLGKDHFLVAMALLLRARRDDSAEDAADSVNHLMTALELVPADDSLAPSIVAMLAAILNDRHLFHGVLEDANAAVVYFDRADVVGMRQAVDGPVDDWAMGQIRGMRGMSKAVLGLRRSDHAGLSEGIEEMRDMLARIPTAYPWRSRIEGVLGLSLIARGLREQRTTDIRTGVEVIEGAVSSMLVDHAGRPALLALSGLAALITDALDDDMDAGDRAIARLTEANEAVGFGHDERSALRSALGSARVVQALRRRSRPDLDIAVEIFEEAEAMLETDTTSAVAVPLLRQLREAYRLRGDTALGDPDQAVRVGLAALRASAEEVMLQSGAGDGLIAARGANDLAFEIAVDCLADERRELAVEALELGRGLVLHAATSANEVSDLLREAGHPGLADEWDRDSGLSAPDWTTIGISNETLPPLAELYLAGEIPSDLRQRVMAALPGAVRARGSLTSAPTVSEIAETLRATSADCLAYLIPATPESIGRLLVITGEGAVQDVPAPLLAVEPGSAMDRYTVAHRHHLESPASDGEAWAQALVDLCDWAGPAAIVPLLDHLGVGIRTPRVVLIPWGALGTVPWHAARYQRDDDDRLGYACADLVISYAASARQLINVIRRDPLPWATVPVFVANPLDDQKDATFEVMALRHVFYPGSVGLGDVGDDSVEPATPDRVLSYLPGRDTDGASLLHLSCHGHSGGVPAESHLRLSDPDSTDPGAAALLPIARILRHAYGRPASAPGGLVVLSACTSDLTGSSYEEALTLATAFLAAGAVSVVGSRWEVSGLMTSPLMFMFHRFLHDEGMRPADALRAAQLWLLDPDREYPLDMPEVFVGDLTTHDFTAIANWAAFAHYGW